LACVLGLAACGITGGEAESVSIRAAPGLFPAFQRGVTDYVVRCPSRRDTVLGVSTRDGSRVALAGGRFRTGAFQLRKRLKTGQSVSLRVRYSGATTRTYHVRCLPLDFPQWTVTRSGKTQAQWYVVTPAPIGATHVSPDWVAIFDARGVPVWWVRRDPPAQNASILPGGVIAWERSNGQPIDTSPTGAAEFHRIDGSLIRILRTARTATDFHELQHLPNGNYLVDTTVPRGHVDLTRFGGPGDATILDGEVQELTPDGKLVWSWNTRDHVSLDETGRWFKQEVLAEPATLVSGRKAYDTVHLNSAADDGKLVLVSARHLDAVFAIEKATGRIVWKLGGTRTNQSLRILGDARRPIDFGGVHDVRLLADGTITLHDNRSGRGKPPRAVRLRIDAKRRTATFVDQIVDRYSTNSPCCGSVRRLATGNWVISWGGTADVVEAKPDGTPVLRIRFGGPFFSYRAVPVMPRTLSATSLRTGMDRMAPR
jgi:Arylsulfotransferase (ASST)